MKNKLAIKKSPWLLLGISIGMASLTGGVYATPIPGTLTGQYFTVLSDPAFNQHQLTSLLVQSQLGPNGLPVFASGSVPLNAPDVTANGEITWWSPSLNTNVTVSSTPTGTVNNPLNSTMFPPAPGIGSNDLNGFLTAHFTATILSADSTIPLYMFLGSDDDAFAYIDGNIISQIGGVHSFTLTSPSSFTLPVGSHTLDIFYANREPTQAQLFFQLDTTPFALVPEPATALLFGTGLLGLLSAEYRRRSQKA